MGRLFLRPPAWLLALLILTSFCSAPQAADRPNIIFFLADDQRWDQLGCAGHPVLQTPHVDELARQGVRFRNMFVTTSICAASRASIFTGLYERVLVRHNAELLAVGSDYSDLTDTDTFINPSVISLGLHNSELGSSRYLTFLLRRTGICDVRHSILKVLLQALPPTSHPLPAWIFLDAGTLCPARLRRLRSPE